MNTRQTATSKPTVVPPARPVARAAPSSDSAAPAGLLRLQRSSLRVSSPSDPAEREAESIAGRISRSAPVAAQPQTIARAPQAPAAAAPFRIGASAPDLQASLSGGMAIAPALRAKFEPSLGADLGAVRLHADDNAAKLAMSYQARAFTVGAHIFFARGAYNPGTTEGAGLLAHELVHTVQQGASPQKLSKAAVQPPAISRSPAMVQRWGIGDAFDSFADKANVIPGFRLLTIAMGRNPINGQSVERSAGNVLRGIFELLPVGGILSQALSDNGIFDKAGEWATKQIALAAKLGASIGTAIKNFLSELSWKDIFDLGGLWDRAKRLVTEPVADLKAFVGGLLDGFVMLIKEAILKPIGRLAQGTEGYKLLCAVLGRDPITGEAVAGDAETLIGGFMKLIGQNEIWENMQKARAVPRAFAWFKGALSGLMGFVSEIPGLFVAAFKSLKLVDILLPPLAFVKLVKVFGSFLGRFTSWAGDKIWNLLEIIFDVVSPGAWGYVKKTGAALKSILQNPIPFMKNLVAAGKLGFSQFGSRFLTHLQNSLIDWLTGSLPGVYIPKAFNLKEIVTFVLSVLGISWAQIRAKLVKVVGEPIMQAMEKTVSIVVTLVRDGPAAAWAQIKEELGNLQDMVVSGITGMVVEMVVMKAIPKLVALFIPGAGFISAIITIYDTIMVFVNKISKIIQVVTAFVNSIVDIASGKIATAADKAEGVLAGLLTLAINFLMGFIGLGKVADKVRGVIAKIRAKVDKAMDAVVAWIVKMAKKLVGAKGKADHPAMGNAAAAEMQKESKTAKGMDGLKAEKQTLAGQLQAKYDKELQAPVTMKITVKDPKSGENKIPFHIHIGPNDYDKDGWAIGSGEPPQVGLYSALSKTTGAKNQEAHHVPPKGLMNWLVQQAKLSLNELDSGPFRDNPEFNWIRELASVDKSVYDPGSPLAAIAVHKETHIKTSGNPADAWRIHFGRETAKAVMAKLQGKTINVRVGDRTYPLEFAFIYKTAELNDEDKKALKEMENEAGTSLVGHATAPPGAENQMVSTQFFKTELNAALDTTKKKWGDGINSFKIRLGTVGRGAAAQSRAAVDAALQNSTKDGTQEERKGSLGQLTGLSKSTWEAVKGIIDLMLM